MKPAIEPVITEAINNPWAMKRLREEVGDPRLTCGLDITNMLSTNNAFRMTEFIDQTFDLLQDQIAYLHAKDIVWNDMLPGFNWAMQGTGLMVGQALGALVGGTVASALGTGPVAAAHAMGVMAVASVAVSVALTPGLRRSRPDVAVLAGARA